MSFYSPSWPLKRGIEDTYETYKDLKSQINFYLKNLLLTSPGENISDLSYGVGLYSFLFEPATQATYSRISSAISTQISSYLPFIVVSEIIVDDDLENIDSNFMRIKIVYTIVEDSETMVFDLELNGSSTMGLY